MTLKPVNIIFALIILAALAFAGCTTQTTSPGATASGSPSSPAGGNDTLSSLYRPGNFKWLEYEMTSNAGGVSATSDIRYEYDTAPYGGVANARHLKYSWSSEGALSKSSTVVDLYYDGNRFLGGHTKTAIGDQAPQESDISPQNYTDTFGSMDMAGSALAIVPAGAETVTVKAGTFACTKYTTTANGPTNTYWVTPAVPGPVKVTTDNKGQPPITMELVGWG